VTHGKGATAPQTPLQRTAQGRARRALAGLLLVALAARVGLVLALPELARADPDAANFRRLALSVAQGRGLSTPEGRPTSERAPLYVLFLAGHYRVFGVKALPPQLTQAVLGTVAVGLSWLLAREARLGARAAFWVVALLAVYPGMIYWNAVLMSETLFQVLFLAWMWMLWRLAVRPSPGRAALAGLAGGVAALCRAEPFYFHLAIVPIVLCWHGAQSRRRRLGAWALSGAMLLVVLAPWAVRNWYAHGEILFTYHGGYVLLTGVNPHRAETYAFGERDAAHAWAQEHVAPYTAGARTEAQVDAARTRAAWAYLREHWTDFVPVWARRVARTWSPWIELRAVEGPSAHLFRAAVFVVEGLLLIGAVVCLCARPWRGRFVWVWVYAGYFTAIHVLYPAMIRYRYPLLPLVAIMGVAGWLWALERRGPGDGPGPERLREDARGV